MWPRPSGVQPGGLEKGTLRWDIKNFYAEDPLSGTKGMNK